MIKVSNLTKTYGKGHTALTVLRDLDFEYEEGRFVGVFGASGSGKSTFLHIVGGLDRPSSGKVSVDGVDIYSLLDEELAEYRNRTIGFVFQFYHLLPEFSAEENIMIPPLIAGCSNREAKMRAEEMLSKVGLVERRKHRPSELSGGEQQRVAIARAIVMRPKLLLADEPTGNLDSHNGEEVIGLLKGLNKEDQMGIVMVTHDASLIKEMDSVLELKGGKLV